MLEKWLAIPGYAGLYEVSDRGRVRALTFANKQVTLRARAIPKILKQRIGSRGYLMVGLTTDGKQVPHLVHRLVLAAFVGAPPSSAMQAAHLNGSCTDNRLANLVWATLEENAAHKVLHGTHVSGEKHGSAKLTAEKVVALRARAAEGATLSMLADEFHISKGHAGKIVNRKLWRDLPTPTEAR